VRRAAWAALALAACAACGGTATPVPADAGAAGPGRARTIRMDIPAEPDVSDVPRLVAREALQQAGYAIEATSYTDNVVATQAMTAGKLDVAILSLPGVLAAIQQGAAITVIMEGSISTRSLVTAPDVTQCSDLNNKQVSVPNLISSQTLSLERFIAKRCPGTHVEKVVIPGANNRLAALLARRTAGAILDLRTVLEVQREDGPRYNVLSVFGADFPGLGGAGVVASREFLDRYPDTARDIVRAWLLATRRIQDPAVLRDRIEKYLGLAPAKAAAAARLYLEKHVWDVNGGLPDGFMERNIQFSVGMGVIMPGMTPAAVQDPRYVHAVLAEIGRQ
jgi:ABC-type nitrate/sulfonate/bicarbonate transport system substrate-binding protein